MRKLAITKCQGYPILASSFRGAAINGFDDFCLNATRESPLPIFHLPFPRTTSSGGAVHQGADDVVYPPKWLPVKADYCCPWLLSPNLAFSRKPGMCANGPGKV